MPCFLGQYLRMAIYYIKNMLAHFYNLNNASLLNLDSFVDRRMFYCKDEEGEEGNQKSCLVFASPGRTRLTRQETKRGGRRLRLETLNRKDAQIVLQVSQHSITILCTLYSAASDRPNLAEYFLLQTSKFFQPFSRIALVCKSVCRRTIADQL